MRSLLFRVHKACSPKPALEISLEGKLTLLGDFKKKVARLRLQGSNLLQGLSLRTPGTNLES